MSAAYIPQVGDRVRTEAWPSNTYTVTAVGEYKLGDRIALIALIHLATDGTLTLHPVERES